MISPRLKIVIEADSVAKIINKPAMMDCQIPSTIVNELYKVSDRVFVIGVMIDSKTMEANEP